MLINLLTVGKHFSWENLTIAESVGQCGKMGDSLGQCGTIGDNVGQFGTMGAQGALDGA